MRSEQFYYDMLHNLLARLVQPFNKSPLSFTGQLCTVLSSRTAEASPDCLLRAPASAALLHTQVCTDGMYREKGVLYLPRTKLQKHSCHRSL